MAQIPEKFQPLIIQGEFSEAQRQMRQELAANLKLDPMQRLELCFEIERLDRIRKDFTRTKEDILAYIKHYIPHVTDENLDRWEQEESLESIIIDGNKRYFNWAGENLFRINKDLNKIKAEKTGPEPPLPYSMLEDVREIIQIASRSQKKLVRPVRVRVTHTVTVKKDIVPDGKVIRCWLPFPREITNRQTDIKLISTIPERHIIAPNEDYLQRTIYLEQPVTAGREIRFQVVFEFTNQAFYQKIDSKKVVPTKLTPELKPFVAERPPHISFTADLKQLSQEIVGQETNPYLIARKIFKWIDENIPWASAREYSTFDNVSGYVCQKRHGDCGMKVFLFLTLCRINGIPTRWQSGLTTRAGVAYRKTAGMHDWGEIYFEPYGWLPVDPDVGQVESNNEDEQWFFLSGMDAYRLIVNDDYAQNIYPQKIHFRSETIDFQRGELEWEGGNLYFDGWDYDYKTELLN